MDNLKHILDAGAALGEPKHEKDYAVVPQGYELRDLEDYKATPRRPRGSMNAADVASFCAYVNKFRDFGTAVFADPASFVTKCVLDYHTAESAAFCEHEAIYAAPRSTEWLVWRSMSGKPMGQVAFATFIEDNQVDIREPSGATILEIARSLQAKSSAEFSSAVSLADGSRQFTYNETISGTSAKGKMNVPSEFKLGVPVFRNGAIYEVVARLRYRIVEGKLTLWYDLYRPEYIEQAAFAEVVAEIADKTTITPYLGTA